MSQERTQIQLHSAKVGLHSGGPSGPLPTLLEPQPITAALLETMSCRTLALRDYQQVLGQVTNTEEYSIGIQDLLLEIRALQKV